MLPSVVTALLCGGGGGAAPPSGGEAAATRAALVQASDATTDPAAFRMSSPVGPTDAAPRSRQLPTSSVWPGHSRSVQLGVAAAESSR